MRRATNFANAKGFTLIETVCTLVIVAVLASYALPRFIDLSDQAYDALVASTAGAFSSSVFLANVACTVRGWANRDNLPGYAGNGVDFNAGCHPTDTANANLIGGNAGRCARLWTALLSPAPSIQTGAAGSADYRALASGETCRFRFLQDAKPRREITYNALTGAVIGP